MKVKEIVVVPKTEREEVVKILCDICEKDILRDRDRYMYYETEVMCNNITAYPGDITGTKTSVHICRSCFFNILLPFIKTKAVHDPTVEEW